VNAAPVTIARMKPLPPRRSVMVCALDIGASKIVCLIGRLAPKEGGVLLSGRTHMCRILGIGVQKSRGVHRGLITDMDEAEDSIRHAVDAAERMAGVQVRSVIVNVSGGRVGSQRFDAEVRLHGHPVNDSHIHRALETAATGRGDGSRAVLHSAPTGFSLDGVGGVRDPRGMVGDLLGAAMHVVECDGAAARNLTLAVERCHLDVEAVVATPYASGLAVLVEDELDLGAIVIDLGAGSTTVAAFAGGRLAHADAIAVGGSHVTMDVARGLDLRIGDAEQIKLRHGACTDNPAEARDTVTIAPIGADPAFPQQVAKPHLVRIVRPRIEEILELVRDRLQRAGFGPGDRHRVVLTGGGAQMPGLAETARRILANQVRIGRPLGVQGLPDAAKTPAFAAAAGLMIYPQYAGIEHFEPQRSRIVLATGTDGYIGRVGRWLRDSF